MFICEECKQSYPDYEQYEVEGVKLCPDCADERTFVCDECGKRDVVEKQEYVEEGLISMTLCEECAGKLLFDCEACNKRFFESEHENADEGLCNNCSDVED